MKQATRMLEGPTAAAIQFDLAQVGIKAQLNPVTLPALIDSIGRRKTVECVVSGWSQDYPDPSDFLDTLFNGNRITEEGCQNISFYNNPRMNALLAEAATCPDPDRRLRIYQAAEQTVVTDAVPLRAALLPAVLLRARTSRGCTGSTCTPFCIFASSGCGLTRD